MDWGVWNWPSIIDHHWIFNLNLKVLLRNKWWDVFQICSCDHRSYLRWDFLPFLAAHVSGEVAETNFVPVEVRLCGFIFHAISVRQQAANPLQQSQTVLFTPLIYKYTTIETHTPVRSIRWKLRPPFKGTVQHFATLRWTNVTKSPFLVYLFIYLMAHTCGAVWKCDRWVCWWGHSRAGLPGSLLILALWALETLLLPFILQRLTEKTPPSPSSKHTLTRLYWLWTKDTTCALSVHFVRVACSHWGDPTVHSTLRLLTQGPFWLFTELSTGPHGLHQQLEYAQLSWRWSADMWAQKLWGLISSLWWTVVESN